MLHSLYALPPNRVRRNYLGGHFLEIFAENLEPKDGNKPEDWIASTVGARNPGLEEIQNEGLAFLFDSEGNKLLLKELFKNHGEFFLGKSHIEKLGSDLGFLAKLLCSSMRLHLQAHPTAEWASNHLNSRWGKLETYVIMGVRENCEGYIWLGFQNSPTAEEWQRIVFEQDMKAMHRCFEKVPVKPGQVWVIPGGYPHAIGEGLLVLETMEPTDWVVRCEFEREGIIVPPPARYMGLEPKKALEIFNFEKKSVDEITQECMVRPQKMNSPNGSSINLLIGPNQTDCFNIRQIIASEIVEIPKKEIIYLGVVLNGEVKIKAGVDEIHLKRGHTFLLPAVTEKFTIAPKNKETEIVICSPGYEIEKDINDEIVT